MIYVHVPFCRSFCTYCDFYSEIPRACREGDDFRGFTASLVREAAAQRGEIAGTLGTNTLYIGGGTPSALPFENLREIVRTLDFGPYDEFTLEVNPEDLVEKGQAYVDALRELGVTRFSMGVQSLDDGILRWMNRRHSSDGARKAFALLEGERSVDIITGVPGMSAQTLKKTVEEIISWRPEHVSAYQLSIEEGSALAKSIAEGQVKELAEDECRAQYELICTELRGAGYRHYEISNWALPGHEARHNSAYWTRKPYVGLGPGAHSLSIAKDGVQTRSWNSRALCGWGVEGSETLSPQEIREESIMLGLRTDAGVDGSMLEGRDISPLEALPNGHFRIPESSFFIADEIISGLL